MSFLLSRRSGSNSLVGTRIQLLTAQQKACSDKDCSPTLRDLREKEKNKVKKFSEIFERKAWILNGNGTFPCNWWLNEKTSSPQGARSSTPKKSAAFVFPTPPPPSAPTKTSFAKTKVDDAIKLKKLLKIELEYVKDLRELISVMGLIPSNAIGYKEMKIRENKFCLFGDLKTILGLHEKQICAQMSKIVAEKGKCVDVIKNIAKLIDDGSFYCYISHKMMEKTTKKFRDENVDTFYNEILRMDPLKMLEIYHNWIVNVCEELIKRPLENADDIAACMDAEEKLEALTNRIADAENVSHIMQVLEAPVEAQFKIYEIIKRNEEIKEIKSPMLFLIPNKHLKYGYRHPLDILRLGKFEKSFEVSMLSQEYEYTYDAKYFVFERCVIFTNILSESKSYCYENHFWIKDVTFGTTSAKEFAKLFNSNHNIMVDNPKLVKLLKDLKLKHSSDEITAEIDMSELDLMKLIDNLGSVFAKKWRRHSFMCP